MAMKIASKKLPIKHIPGPEGVRGRNSDNTLIKKVLGWAPSIKLQDGLNLTFVWIKNQVDVKRAGGAKDDEYTTSKVVKQETTSLDALDN